jgi:hypothetical protein
MRTGNIMIGAVKSGKIVFDGHKRVFYKDEKGDNFVAFVSGYDEITTDPGNSDEITKKLQSWAKRKGFKINKGIGTTESYPMGDSALKRLGRNMGFSIKTVKNRGVYFIKGEKKFGPFDGRYNSKGYVMKKIS